MWSHWLYLDEIPKESVLKAGTGKPYLQYISRTTSFGNSFYFQGTDPGIGFSKDFVNLSFTQFDHFKFEGSLDTRTRGTNTET